MANLGDMRVGDGKIQEVDGGGSRKRRGMNSREFPRGKGENTRGQRDPAGRR